MRWFVLLVCVVTATAQELEEFKEVYTWNKLSFSWPDDVTRLRALSDSKFLEDSCALNGIRVWRDRLFVTVPRWRTGVPATLVTLPAHSPNNVSSPPLQAFPSWDMQGVGNCSALQSVTNIEIDRAGKLWAPDSGTTDGRCPPKVVQFEADTGRVLRTYSLPADVVASDSLLADIVVSDDEKAYISDASPSNPGIIVLDGRDGRTWKMSEERSMRGENTFVQVEQRRTELRYNVFGLALAPRDPTGRAERRLYYAPLNSYNLFSLPVSALSSPTYRSSLANLVKDHGKRISPSQAMTFDSAAHLYSGLLKESGVARWDTTRDISEEKLISQDHVRLQWPSSFTIDDKGYLWLVSNRMQNYMAGVINQNDANYRVIRAFVDAKSYMNDLSAPTATGIPSSTTTPAASTSQAPSTPHSTKTNGAQTPAHVSLSYLFVAIVFGALLV